MGDTVKRLIVATIVIGAAAAAAAQQRLAVLEFFGRPTGGYCSAAGPTMIRLQSEMEEAAVLLEYDYDQFPSGRLDRFLAARPRPPYLPLVMVGSGFKISDGLVDFEPEYRAMIEAELARPAEADVSAYWRRVGDRMRVYVRAVNRRDEALTPSEEAAIWVLVWEEGTTLGVSRTWVRATGGVSLSDPLDPGAAATMVVNSPQLTGVNWARLSALAMVERRPGGSGGYDMLQATLAAPPGLDVSPGELVLSRARPTVEVSLAGPHVLSWSATWDVPWLDVTPSGGTVPAAPTIALSSDEWPPQPATGTVRFDAQGDGMTFSATVAVTAAERLRHSGPRLTPAPRPAEAAEAASLAAP